VLHVGLLFFVASFVIQQVSWECYVTTWHHFPCQAVVRAPYVFDSGRTPILKCEDLVGCEVEFLTAVLLQVATFLLYQVV
jgi:hypothetical protein